MQGDDSWFTPLKAESVTSIQSLWRIAVSPYKGQTLERSDRSGGGPGSGLRARASCGLNCVRWLKALGPQDH
eukprot:153117-Hanusia_phi.AAC.5